MSQNEKALNAEDILPRALLRKLQHYCSGLVYISKRGTGAQSNKDRIRLLHGQGITPVEIANRTTLSVQHVRKVIKELSDGSLPEQAVRHKIYESVPEDIVEMVQRYVEGPVYVPAGKSSMDRRHARVKKLLSEGYTTVEVARRTKMSERRVWQLKVEYAEEIIDKKEPAKKHMPIGDSPAPAAVPMINATETREVPPRVCRLCGNVLAPHEGLCVICSRQTTKEEGDPDIIVVSRLPFAVIDREF
ncbi:MAG: hypothetical protein ACYC0V_21440 [Armatimonadota bacterium]